MKRKKGDIPLVYLVENLVADPGFRPGFRQVRAGLRHAHDKLTTFRVEKLVADVIDLSRHVVIDLACRRPARWVFDKIDRWNVEATRPTNLLELF